MLTKQALNKYGFSLLERSYVGLQIINHLLLSVNHY